MKKILVTAAALALVGLAASAIALAASGKDYTGPTCNNLTGGDGAYTTYGGTEAILDFSATTAAPTCAKTTYTLYVLDASGTTQLASQPLSGGTAMACPDNGGTSTSCLEWTIDLGPATTAPSVVCIYGTSSGSNKVNDRAPDADGSCLQLQLDSSGSGGFGGFN